MWRGTDYITSFLVEEMQMLFIQVIKKKKKKKKGIGIGMYLLKKSNQFWVIILKIPFFGAIGSSFFFFFYRNYVSGLYSYSTREFTITTVYIRVNSPRASTAEKKCKNVLKQTSRTNTNASEGEDPQFHSDRQERYLLFRQVAFSPNDILI